MAAMRLRIMFLCVLLGACATAEPLVSAPPLGVALNCTADTAMTCPRAGCRAPGPQSPSRLALIVPARGEVGRYCISGTCEDARFLPTLTRALGWTAQVSTGPGLARPLGEVEIGSERSTFVLRQPRAQAMYVWGGYCTPAGS